MRGTETGVSEAAAADRGLGRDVAGTCDATKLTLTVPSATTAGTAKNTPIVTLRDRRRKKSLTGSPSQMTHKTDLSGRSSPRVVGRGKGPPRLGPTNFS